MEIRVLLRNGDSHTLDFREEDAQAMFDRLTNEPIEMVYSAGWLPVRSSAAKAFVSAAEVISITLIDPSETTTYVPDNAAQ